MARLRRVAFPDTGDRPPLEAKRIILRRIDGRGTTWRLCTRCGSIVRVNVRKKHCPYCESVGTMISFFSVKEMPDG